MFIPAPLVFRIQPKASLLNQLLHGAMGCAFLSSMLQFISKQHLDYFNIRGLHYYAGHQVRSIVNRTSWTSFLPTNLILMQHTGLFILILQ